MKRGEQIWEEDSVKRRIIRKELRKPGEIVEEEEGKKRGRAGSVTKKKKI